MDSSATNSVTGSRIVGLLLKQVGLEINGRRLGEVDLFSCRTSHSVSLLGMSALRLFTLVLRKDKDGFLQYDGYE